MCMYCISMGMCTKKHNISWNVPVRYSTTKVRRVAGTFVQNIWGNAFAIRCVSSGSHVGEVSKFSTWCWAGLVCLSEICEKQCGQVLIWLCGLCKADQRAAKPKDIYESTDIGAWWNISKESKWATTEGCTLMGLNIMWGSLQRRSVTCRKLTVPDTYREALLSKLKGWRN